MEALLILLSLESTVLALHRDYSEQYFHFMRIGSEIRSEEGGTDACQMNEQRKIGSWLMNGDNGTNITLFSSECMRINCLRRTRRLALSIEFVALLSPMIQFRLIASLHQPFNCRQTSPLYVDPKIKFYCHRIAGLCETWFHSDVWAIFTLLRPFEMMPIQWRDG